jgi:hypothetical protein
MQDYVLYGSQYTPKAVRLIIFREWDFFVTVVLKHLKCATFSSVTN